MKCCFCCGILGVRMDQYFIFACPAKPRPSHAARRCFSPLSFLFRTSCAAYFVLNCSVICSVLVQMKSAVRAGRPGGIEIHPPTLSPVRAAGNFGTNAISSLALCLRHQSSIIQTSCLSAPRGLMVLLFLMRTSSAVF